MFQAAWEAGDDVRGVVGVMWFADDTIVFGTGDKTRRHGGADISVSDSPCVSRRADFQPDD